MSLRPLGALTLVAVLGLSACSDDPEPKVAPEPSTSTAEANTATASSSATPLADEAAFIEEFFQRVSTSISSGDPSGFKALADDTCANCKVIAENLESAYDNGGSIVDGKWTVLSAEPSSISGDSDVWDVRVRTSRERWLDSGGDVVKTVAPSVQTIAMSLRAHENGWRVRELQLR